MKKFAVLLLAVMLCSLAAVSFAAAVDFSGMTDDDLRQLRSDIDVELSARQAARTLEGGTLMEGDVGDYHVALLGLTKTKDYDKNPAIVLRILFTNNSSEKECFSLAIDTSVYQNGVELDTAYGLDEVDSSKSLLDVKPGASIEVTKGYKLTDENAPVEIELEDMFDFSDNPDIVIGTFAIPE